jgi:hypothetical protein
VSYLSINLLRCCCSALARNASISPDDGHSRAFVLLKGGALRGLTFLLWSLLLAAKQAAEETGDGDGDGELMRDAILCGVFDVDPGASKTLGSMASRAPATEQLYSSSRSAVSGTELGFPDVFFC